MKRLKLTLFSGIAATLLLGSSPVISAGDPAAAVQQKEYEPGTWTESYEVAMTAAAKLKRPVLMDFTGSDWCGWCIRLDKEVFSQPAFQNYAKESLILLKVDFPSKLQQSAEQKKQNRMLAEKYKIRGYPSIILLNASGKEIAQTGYLRGGAEKYVEHLKG